ncbi:MAG: cytochrome b/b6 domain-containing protein [Steroidobacteraceae bacterium]
MRPVPESTVNRLHLAVVAVVVWLVGTSPWVAMLRRVPSGAGWFDRAHVVLGFAGLVLGVAYAIACLGGGGWRSLFPWLSGGLGAVGRDVVGLLRGRVPAAEGGGLYAMIEGLLLVALLVAGATGGAWYLSHGGASALAWRAVHVASAQVLMGFVVLHVLAVASHLLDLAR